MIKVIMDCQGGDNSPSVNIKGAVAALEINPDLALILTGEEEVLNKELSNYTYDKARVSIIHASETISCDEKPTLAIKRTESSLVKALDTLRTDDSVAALVTLGSTGALLAGAVLRLGRIRGVARPSFCPIVPTMNGGFTAVCDSGANAECDVKNLVQNALMGSLYMEKTYNIVRPRVALLNIGTEEHKGDTLRQETYLALKQMPQINFVGNMESRDLLSGKYDVVVADGFSGNVLIKSTEGTALEMLKLLKRTFTSSLKNKLGALLLKKSIYDIKNMMDYNNYGGGVMLGTKKVIVKAHGSSNHNAVKNCLLQAYDMEKGKLCQTIAEQIEAINAQGNN